MSAESDYAPKLTTDDGGTVLVEGKGECIQCGSSLVRLPPPASLLNTADRVAELEGLLREAQSYVARDAQAWAAHLPERIDTTLAPSPAEEEQP